MDRQLRSQSPLGHPQPPAAFRPNLLVRIAHHLGWGWVFFGMAASVAMVVSGPALVTATDGPATRWWFSLPLPTPVAHTGDLAVFYAGMVGLSIAWLGLGRRLRRSRGATAGELWLVAALWVLPLLAAPALFSRDVFSYMGQGALAHLGLSPYRYGPQVLSGYGYSNLVSAVAPVWRATPAPYGPLFLAIAGALMGAIGTHVATGVVVFRLVELVGVGLIAAFVPRLASRLGADPARALWLSVLSPLVLLELVAAGHNDALWVGLLVAGVALALDRRPLLGIVLCALAASIKAPAAAGVVFVAVVWARERPTRPGRAGALALAAGTAGAVLVAVSLGTGLGFGWLSGSALSTPGDVTVAITPTTALGITFHAFAHHVLGGGLSEHTALSALRLAGLGAAGLFGALLLWRVRARSLVLYLSLALLGVVLAGPVLWPWYLTWSFVLLAACPEGQRSRALVLVLAAFGFVVGPGGDAAVPLVAAPAVAALCGVAAIAAVIGWWRYLHRRPPSDRGQSREPGLVVARATLGSHNGHQEAASGSTGPRNSHGKLIVGSRSAHISGRGWQGRLDGRRGVGREALERPSGS